jgi:hypothetical protein
MLRGCRCAHDVFDRNAARRLGHGGFVDQRDDGLFLAGGQGNPSRDGRTGLPRLARVIERVSSG